MTLQYYKLDNNYNFKNQQKHKHYYNLILIYGEWVEIYKIIKKIGKAHQFLNFNLKLSKNKLKV